MSTTVERSRTAPKIAKLQEIMERKQLDAVVVSSYQNVSYFGGTYLMSQITIPDRLAFLIVPKREDPTLVVFGIATRQGLSQTDIKDVRDYVGVSEDPSQGPAQELAEAGPH